MRKQLLILIVLMVKSVALSNAETVIEIDTPNPGDTSTTITYTTGTVTTTNNLISQTWNDGTWNGTQFPDSSDLSENIFVTGKHQKYLETTISSTDLMTEAEIQQGFTSNFGVQARWWNNQASTFTMYQTAVDNLGNATKQSTVFEDTTNHNYQFNPYANTLIVAPNENLTHGNITAGFSFDIQGSATYNGGHVGVDLRSPSLTIDYQTLSQTSVTTIEYCYEKNPPTCPGQDEIDAVEDMIENFVPFAPEEIYTLEYTNYFVPETIDFKSDNIEVQTIDYYEMPLVYDMLDMDMEINMEEMQIENFEVEVMTMDATDMMPNFENIEVFEQELSMPQDNYFDSVPTDMDMFDIAPMDTEVLVEMFTAEPEFVEEPMLEEAPIEIIEEPMVEEVSEPVVMASAEPIIEDKPMQEIVMEEEPIDEPEIEEQSSSEELVADEPVSEPETTEQEEIIEEPVEAKVESKPEPTVEEDIVTEKPKIDIANIERVIKEQVTNKIQQVTATLDVVNEVLSREMTANQPDLSAYTALNNAMIDNRQLPGGNPAFFNQVALVGYDKTIYQNQISMATIDPVAQHEVKMDIARDKTNKAYFKLKALLEARQ